jgi:hypothetical protein
MRNFSKEARWSRKALIIKEIKNAKKLFLFLTETLYLTQWQQNMDSEATRAEMIGNRHPENVV